MIDAKITDYIAAILKNMPSDWLSLTTHRLDIYDEGQAKTEFLDHLDLFYNKNEVVKTALAAMPTAYDYIRLGHPLSCVLEWGIARLHHLEPKAVISFSSQTTPILAILRKNLLDTRKTRILYTGELPHFFTAEIIKNVYGYSFDLQKIKTDTTITEFDGSTILVSKKANVGVSALHANVDFYINLYDQLGSILLINGAHNNAFIPDIQHVRRRETIAMTPSNCLVTLQSLVSQNDIETPNFNLKEDKAKVVAAITDISNTNSGVLAASSGLSIQYAIMMGLIHDAQENHKGKAIKFIVPTNCYGGTNDQARRVAACIANVEVVDLAVDGDNDMVTGIDAVLHKLAQEDAVPYIIAEIPTNPRVEVPDLEQLKAVLSVSRTTANGAKAVDSVFILDQTFCPNIHFLGEDNILGKVRAIAYASGSKFPSGGKCTAGYCVPNKKAAGLLEKIELHLSLCDNEATALQYELLAKQLPSMNQRIADAYTNTREFVSFIEEVLPAAKINFVSEELTKEGFTPSVFSLDLPTTGNTAEEKEGNKRALNLKLINLMITEIPNESKFCVSYGQLKGCYWTIPATSTQGTTKEGDKDYIVRASLSGNMDLAKHKEVFMEFVGGM